MLFSRFQGGIVDSLDTHNSKYYKKIFLKYKALTNQLEGEIIDPFARNCKWGTITNDLNSKFECDYNMCALEFSNILIETKTKAKIILFDPPFSINQAERYKEEGMNNLYTNPNLISNLCKNLSSILSPNGYFIKLGYNSTRPNKNLELVELTVVNFGGSRNDVIVSVWKNVQNKLVIE